ncbi:odorant receptor Or2-like [Phlebotomus papatasi]|uniref:odorant receptor Or2-like n=1 Tax=Phlebotomus papatasi TaxID=29031 RepID=UPI00248384AE|nr:odorant receptor Or2-like [Phlebotomus papatasi]
MKTAEEVPFVAFSVKVWKFMGFLFATKYSNQRYFFLLINVALNISQFAYLFTEEKLDKLILNGYFTVWYFNCIMRVVIVLKRQKDYEDCIHKLVRLYNFIETTGDEYMVNLLQEVGKKAHRFSIMNVCLSLTTGACFLIYPVFTGMQDLPYGVYVPFLNTSNRFTYKLLYLYEILATPPGVTLYIPFSNLVISFFLFAHTLMQILRYKLNILMDPEKDQDEKMTEKKLKIAIKYHQVLIVLIDDINSLVVSVSFIEIIFFTMLLCALLFVLNIVELLPQICLSCLYIVLIMTQLFTLYWGANEVTVESLKVREALYDMPWYNMNEKCKKLLLIVMIRSSRPLQIVAGNIYPVTLQMFQSLANVSYSYFTILRRVYQ